MSRATDLPIYRTYGGLFREEAIMLLRKFYVQENDKAPNPAAKKGRVLKTDIPPLTLSLGVMSPTAEDDELESEMDREEEGQMNGGEVQTEGENGEPALSPEPLVSV